ncbi:hypothetical protein DPMN_091361 [Dreissena polymorpha]|uniref:Uncharacterized protein n=1 Tax=Dreissena polymorpha TaxID=45954 RepID=A0A9D4KZT5_DREPO|nr:hypothetical protein DPMN_091361 [Dreissena polymorpha]
MSLNFSGFCRTYIIGTNLPTKFHEDQKINVASRVLTRKNAPSPGSHIFQPTGIIVELIPDIIRMNLLTKFHEDRTVNVTSRVLTRFYYSHIRKNAPPLGSHFFQANIIIFKLIQDIIETNLLTKFHDDWTINVASRVLTRKNATPVGGHVFQANTNLLTIFHQDWTINVASRVLTRKNAPPPGGHVFQPTGIIFELVQDIIGMNLLTKKNAPPLGSHVFQANVTIFELIQDIIKTNLLTKFHEDWTINVASRELTRQMLTQHNAQQTTDKKRSQKLTMSTTCSDFIKINILTKFHKDWMKIINILTKFHKDWMKTVTSTVYTNKLLRINILTKFHKDWKKTATSIINILTKFHKDWIKTVTSTVYTRFFY